VTKKSLQRLGAKRVEVFPESGMARDEIEILRKVPPRNSSPFRFVSIGRLLHWKGFHLSLNAFALFSREFPDSEYWFIGDGPEKKNLERLATNLEVTGRVRFLGNIPRPLVLRDLSECDVLVHPSLHDSGGWVCLEAMAAGRPVICLDLGGPSVQVTAETGIKVPAEGVQQAIMDLKEGMTRLAGNRNLLEQMSRAARLRVEEYFNWNRKGEWMTMVYNSILDQDFQEKGVTISWWTKE
jgi:glycosyltransferase involved in cell wall biosynthesis